MKTSHGIGTNHSYIYGSPLSSNYMTDPQTHYSLQKLNTFGLDIHAAKFCSPKSLESLSLILEKEEIRELPRLILGEGSNLLFTKNFEGIGNPS